MALKSTIFKAALNIADMDRQVYGDYPLTLARHPSETDERMMLRLLAFALHADAALTFGKGISTNDEPDLWRKDLSGDIELWIELGTPEPGRLRKACGRSQEVALYCYGGRGVEIWWEKNRAELARCKNLQVYNIDSAASQQLADMAATGMDIQCTIEGGEAWLSSGQHSVNIRPQRIERS
jgi:uncharacterized protein YaeQ